MRFFAISIVSLYVVLPTVAVARLPVVNVSGGGISARSAFGAGDVQNDIKNTAGLYGAEPSGVTDTIATTQRTVSTRPVVQRNAQKATVTPPVMTARVADKDVGAKIIKAEVLSPRRPSGDLWAQSDMPLRMPGPEEFTVVRSDTALPEESLDRQEVGREFATQRTQTNIAKTKNSTRKAPLAELDSEIARLTELQHQADVSLHNDEQVVSGRTVQSAFAQQRSLVSNSVLTDADLPISQKTAVTRTVVGRVPGSATNNSSKQAQPVKLSRLVVPMDNDVTVRSVKRTESPRIVSVRDDMTKLSPAQLRQAFRKTFLSENKHLSTYPIDDRFDTVSDMSSGIEGFTARRDLSEDDTKIRPLEIKIKFRNEDSALSRDNYDLLSEYAGVVLSNPMRAIQIGIPQSVTENSDSRKLAARRLAIIEQVLRDTGVSEQRILPVLSARSEDSFVLRMISSDQYETLTQQQKNVFGDTVKKKTYKSMAW